MIPEAVWYNLVSLATLWSLFESPFWICFFFSFFDYIIWYDRIRIFVCFLGYWFFEQGHNLWALHLYIFQALNVCFSTNITYSRNFVINLYKIILFILLINVEYCVDLLMFVWLIIYAVEVRINGCCHRCLS